LATFSAKSAVRDLLTQLLPSGVLIENRLPDRLLHRLLWTRQPITTLRRVLTIVLCRLLLFNATSRSPFFDASDPQQMEVYWFILVYAHARKVTSLLTLYCTMTRGCRSVQNQRTLFPEPGFELSKERSLVLPLQ
jgi:hypothetical protein